MLRTLKGAAFVLGCLGLSGCSTPDQREAAESAAIKKEVAAEIDRICSLAEPERTAELEKVKRESGMELYCARQ